MQGQIDRFVDDLRDSFNLVTDVKADCDNIILCGMGGSAISGDVVADLCFDRSKININVLRYPVFPGWADEKTLAVISSYSGNTWETKAMYDEAIKRGCQIVVISSGGDIWNLAEERGDTLIPLCIGVQPRQAVGLMIGYICKIIDLVAETNLEKEILDSFDVLKKFNFELKNKNNLALDLANYIHDKIPVISTDTSMASISLRWKTQISENSKMIAFSCVMPEFNHNEIVGWSTPTVNNLAPIIIVPNIQIQSVKEVMDACVCTLEKYNTKFYKVNLIGSTRAECVLKGMILGDYVSYYLALMNKVDPIEVEPIKSLKMEITNIRNGNVRTQ